MRRLLAALVFCTLALFTKESLAWFQICNRRPDGLWASYSSYVAGTSQVNDECGYSTRNGGCYYSSWRTEGWWRLEPNQCAVVLGGSITNRYSYVYVESDWGATLIDAQTPFYVRDQVFSWDEYEEVHWTSGECIGSYGVYDFCTPTGYWVNFKEFDTGNASNFTLNIT
jgi:uncharacterized membrane protein